MAECEAQAQLIITLMPEGTTTNVVRRRAQLRCSLGEGHDGPHRDTEHGEEWERGSTRPPTLLRHEDEER
jgi:hypothetical protein